MSVPHGDDHGDDGAGSASMDAQLAELADGHRIATEYWDWQGRHTVVARDTLVAVLAALGVDGTRPAAGMRRLSGGACRPRTPSVPCYSFITLTQDLLLAAAL